MPTSELDAEGSTIESSSVTGARSDVEPVVQKPGRKVQVKVRRPAVGGVDDEEIEQGRDRGGPRRRKREGGPLPGFGADGEGASRIRGRDLRFRSWSAPTDDATAAIIAVAIIAESDESGDLELVALGPGGEPEKGFELGISRAVLHGPDGKVDVSFSGNMLRNIRLSQGQKTRIDIYVPAGERYRLEAV
ncbi:hypothetical protein [Marinobacterium aestuariivivens]|uniref:Uncharacterized protein n=1 Tax=Marinobacterium aestuariivivens TaxID=1698799 RepID=A0ABW2A301_9GAMM